MEWDYMKNIEVVGNVAHDVDYGIIFIGNLRSETCSKVRLCEIHTLFERFCLI